MKNKKDFHSDFIFTDIVQDDQLEMKYRKRVIDHVSYKKIEEEDFLNLSITSRKLNIFFIIISLLLIVLLARVFYLQIYKGDYYRSVAEGNRIRIQTIKASRGLIYDRNNQLLVKNIPNFTLTIIKGDLPKNIDSQNIIINYLSQRLQIPEIEIKDRLAKAAMWTPIEIADNLSYEQAIDIMVQTPQMPGVKCEPLATREYNNAIGLSHVIGYLGKINQAELAANSDEDYLINDYIGKSGLELYYEKILNGIDGKKQIEIDSRGDEIKTIAEKESQAGKSLSLTIDADLQDKTYAALEKYSKLKQSKGASAVVLDPRNGEILALVSWPGFDTNAFIKGISQEDYQKLSNDENKPLFNKTIAGEYPSGSTFKPVVAAAALQEGVITSETTVNSTGGITIHGYKYPDWKSGGHGITNLTKALSESVNTFFYIAGGGTYNGETNKIEGGLGIEKINYYANKFGLGQKTNIDLPGEKPGFLPSREWKKQTKGEDWYIGDTYHVAIGQGDILVTPLQVANFTEVVANGGTLYQPHLLKKIIGSDKQTSEQYETKIINKDFISKDNLDQVKWGMREAVLSGSAKKLDDLPVAVAAKTGTAQHTGSDKNHSWLTAFAPYNSPEIVISVIVEEGGEGTEAALPVVQEVINWYFSR